MGKQNLKVGAGKSKWFARLVMLAMGLVLSVGGVLGIVHFNSAGGDIGQEYAYATATLTPGDLRISGNNLTWRFRVTDSDNFSYWHSAPRIQRSSSNFSNPNHRISGLRWTNTEVLRAGTVVHTLNWTNLNRCCCNGGVTRPANTINMNTISALTAVGSHNITIRTNFREYRDQSCCCTTRWNFVRNRAYTSAVINRTITGTLGVPGNVRMVGDVLHWNAVGSANGYRVYRGTTLVQAVGNVTSLNLAGNANVPVGTRHTLSVSATSTASYWHTSARGGSAQWGQLSTPTGVAVNGTTLSWNAVANATGYQIRRGTTVIATVGNVTSHNLMSVSVANLAVGAHTNLNVVATTTTSGWISSAASANASWTRFSGLCVPSDVVLNGSTVSWGIGTNTFAFINNFHIRVGNTILATVGRDARSFDLSTIPEGRNAARNTATAGSLGALQTGTHSINIISASNLAEWPDSAQSASVSFYRAGRVDSVSISGTQNLIVAWPRPDGINGMPTGQLSASITGVYGTNSAVVWDSVNPDIVSVDAASGAIRASWPDGMTMWELSQRVNQFTIIRATSVVGGVVAEFHVTLVFSTPPVPVVVGLNVVGGARELELAPCGTKLAGSGASLVGATQFSASAFGYNLAGSGNVFSWASSDESIATIDAEGRLTVRGVGVVRITATSSVGNVPYAFYVTIVRDGTAIATGVTIFCDNDNSAERRLGIIPGDTYGFVDLRAVIEGHNIVSQLVTWTSSCGATLGNPSEFLSMALTADGVRFTGRAAGGPFVITATPVGAIGTVGNFRIFVDQLVEPEVTSVSVGMPSTSSLVIPLARPILTTDLPSVQLTASLTGVGGAANSNVIWTSSCGARAGFGIETIAGEFVAFVLNLSNPNIVTVIAQDRGQKGFSQPVSITATSVVTPSVSASRELTVQQAALTGINVTTSIGGQAEAQLMIPYGYTDINARGSIDLRAVVSVSDASVSGDIIWVAMPANAVIFDNKHTISQSGTHSGAIINAVTLRPVVAGVVTITAKGALCGTPSNEFTLTIVEECRTSVRIIGPIAGAFGYEMNIVWPRPDDILLPIAQLGASVGGSFARASSLVWTSSCGGAVVEFLGSNVGGLVMLRAVGAGVVTITATEPSTDFAGTFTIAVDKARLESLEILGDNVVREQTAMLIPLVYTDGVYTLSDVTARQSLELSLIVNTHGDVTTDFIWTSSDNSVVRIFGTGSESEYENGDNGFSKITDRNGFVTVLPYGVGTATITATSIIDPTFYATFTIFVTRGTASCSIQDGILDLPTIEEGYVRIILVCEHYFGQARMSHYDITLQYALEFILPHLQLNIYGAIFHGWSLSRNGELLQTCPETEQLLLPLHLLNIENGADTLLLFAVWYIPHIPSENGSSNLARNIIIGTLGVAGVGAAGTAGYIAQSKIRARRKSDIDEWGLDN